MKHLITTLLIGCLVSFYTTWVISVPYPGDASALAPRTQAFSTLIVSRLYPVKTLYGKLLHSLLNWPRFGLMITLTTMILACAEESQDISVPPTESNAFNPELSDVDFGDNVLPLAMSDFETNDELIMIDGDSISEKSGLDLNSYDAVTIHGITFALPVRIRNLNVPRLVLYNNYWKDLEGTYSDPSHAITIENNVAHLEISYNTFENIHGYAIYFAESGYSEQTLISHNLMHKIQGTAILIGSQQEKEDMGIIAHQQIRIENNTIQHFGLNEEGAINGRPFHGIYATSPVTIQDNTITNNYSADGNGITFRSYGVARGNTIREGRKGGIVYFPDHHGFRDTLDEQGNPLSHLVIDSNDISQFDQGGIGILHADVPEEQFVLHISITNNNISEPDDVPDIYIDPDASDNIESITIEDNMYNVDSPTESSMFIDSSS